MFVCVVKIRNEVTMLMAEYHLLLSTWVILRILKCLLIRLVRGSIGIGIGIGDRRVLRFADDGTVLAPPYPAMRDCS